MNRRAFLRFLPAAPLALAASAIKPPPVHTLVISGMDHVEPGQLTRLRDQLDALYRGPAGAGRLVILPNGAKLTYLSPDA